MNTVNKGEYACLKVSERAIEKNAIVSKPIIEVGYDRVIDYQGKLYRSQIKWADGKSLHSQGAIIVNLKRGARNNNIRAYTSEEIDALLVYTPSTEKIYWFGPDVFENKYTLSIRITPPKNNQIKGCIMADDYEW